MRDADEALALIADDLLGVSAGFAIGAGGEDWHGNRRRVRRALIDHVALVPEPAYEAAKITAVRGRELLAQR
jgi:phage head maturation protease